MKKITEPERHGGANALGQTSITMRHEEEIEASDVGKKEPHYLGYKAINYPIKASDVGRIRVVVKDPDDKDYVSWYFRT